MPVSDCVAAILDRKLSIDEAVDALMNRPVRSEESSGSARRTQCSPAQSAAISPNSPKGVAHLMLDAPVSPCGACLLPLARRLQPGGARACRASRRDAFGLCDPILHPSGLHASGRRGMRGDVARFRAVMSNDYQTGNVKPLGLSADQRRDRSGGPSLRLRRRGSGERLDPLDEVALRLSLRLVPCPTIAQA